MFASNNRNSQFQNSTELSDDKEKPKPINKPNENQISLAKVSTIDNLDTVVFDMFNSVLVGNKVTFPVRFYSDDSPIFALDFSFKYNQTKLLLDTIINLKPSIFSALAFYNPFDSILRFTSSGLGSLTYPDSMPIAEVRFTVLSGTLSASDLNTVKSLLNGDPCSPKVTTYSTVGLNDIVKTKNQVLIYPNPTDGILKINSSQNAEAELTDINGKIVIDRTKILSNQVHTFELDNLAKGIYMMKVSNNNFIQQSKVVVR